MATPVGWKYGPWRTQTSTAATPYATVPAAAEVLPGVTPGQVAQVYQDVGGGIGGKDITGTREYGPLTGAELAGMWGGTLANRALGMGINTAISGSLPSITPTSFLGLAPKAAVTVASMLSSLFGGVRGIDAEDPETALANEGYLGQAGIAQSRGNQPGGWAGATTAPSPSVSNPDIGDMTGYGPSGYGRNEPGGGGLGDDGGSGGQGQDSGSSNTGGAPGGDAPGNWAKGGVKTFRRPSRPLVGEAGPETGLFVPERWKAPGQQPREAETEAKMRELLRALRG